MDSACQIVESEKVKNYERKIDGLKRERAIYEYVLENVGAKIIKTKLLRKFGYSVYESNSENFEKSRLVKYTIRTFVGVSRRITRHGPVPIYKRYINDVVWLPTDLVKEHRITTVSSQRWNHRLCYKNTVPFWLFKEYGGPYTGREFIIEIDKIVRELDGHMRATNEQLNR